MPRLGANDLLLIDTGYIAWSIQPDCFNGRIRIVVDLYLDGDGDNAGLVGRSVGDFDAGRGALSHPGQEHVVCSFSHNLQSVTRNYRVTLVTDPTVISDSDPNHAGSSGYSLFPDPRVLLCEVLPRLRNTRHLLPPAALNLQRRRWSNLLFQPGIY